MMYGGEAIHKLHEVKDIYKSVPVEKVKELFDVEMEDGKVVNCEFKKNV